MSRGEHQKSGERRSVSATSLEIHSLVSIAPCCAECKSNKGRLSFVRPSSAGDVPMDSGILGLSPSAKRGFLHSFSLGELPVSRLIISQIGPCEA